MVEHDISLVSKSKNIAHEAVPGDAGYERNFSEQVLDKIAAHNFRKQEPKKLQYLKPTKAALYGLHLRFQSMERRKAE